MKGGLVLWLHFLQSIVQGILYRHLYRHLYSDCYAVCTADCVINLYRHLYSQLYSYLYSTERGDGYSGYIFCVPRWTLSGKTLKSDFKVTAQVPVQY